MEIYLDACATSPPRMEVISKVNEIQANLWGNPSSLHIHGIQAAEVIERSRNSIAKNFGASANEIIYTSGATESIHLGLVGWAKKLKPGRIIISSVEHPSVVSAANALVEYGWQLEYWPVDHLGRIRIDKIDQLLAKPTKIVSIVWGQSEIGTIQPIEEIGKYCRDRDIIFHTDATQILTSRRFNWSELPVDLMSFSIHKFQGPKGVGILLARSSLIEKMEAMLGGGGQEYGKRSGTQPVELIAGMALAIDLLMRDSFLYSTSNKDKNNIYNLTKYLKSELEKQDNITFTGDPECRLINHISMLIKDRMNKPIPGRLIVRVLSSLGVSSSSGSACKSGVTQDSEILRSMGFASNLLQSGLRLSLGPWLQESDIKKVPEILIKALHVIDS